MNAITTIDAVLRRSGRRIISSLAMFLLVCGAVLVPAASATAQVVGYFADPYITIYGGASGANGNHLNIGNTFNVTGAGITVYQLGAFDWQGDGLASSHIVTLFTNQTAIASVTVPAGTAAPLNDGFRWAPLGTPIFLPAGQYAVVSYQMNSSDPYGDYNSGIPSDFNTGASVTRGGGIFDFVTSTTAYPTQNGGGYNFISASFTYIDSTAVWNGAGANNNWSTFGNWNAAPSFPTILTFAGTTQLTNNNDLSSITLNGLTFDSTAGAFVLGGNDITLNGNIGFGAIPATPVTETVNLNMTSTAANLVIETPTNGTLKLGGNLTSSVNTSLIKIDNGTLTLGGTNAIQSWDLNGGTTKITGNTTINGGGGGGRIYVGDGDYLNHCSGTLDIEPGAVLNIIGNFDDTFVLGRDGGSGTVIQNGGTFTFNPGNSGTIWLVATGDAASRSEYHMNGGVLDMSFNTLGLALAVNGGTVITGLVNQVSGVITNVYNLWVGFNINGGVGHGIYNLTGGSIYIGALGITTSGGSYEVNLGGGTVGAYQSWASSLNMNLTGINGPVTFNPAGNTITLSGALSGTGGLTMAGGGTLELSGANTYTGDTVVNAGGTLKLDATGSDPTKIRLANSATLNLNYSGNYSVLGFYTNGVALPVGTYNNGNLSTFITGTGNLVVSSSISTGIWTGLGANNNWNTAGNWDQNAVPLFPIGLTFGGSTRLTNTNNLSSITASSITFSNTAGAFTIGGNDITLSGPIGFSSNPAALITQAINLNMALSSSETIDTPTNGNLTLGGNLTSSSDTSLIKIDTGTLTLGGVNTILSWGLNGGTTTITGNTTINGDGGRVYVGDGDYLGNCNATLNIQPGAVLNITGSFGDTFVIGRDSGSGTVNQNGGTFTFNDGTMWLVASGSSASRSVYNMNGGLLDMQGTTLGLGLGANGGTLVTGLVNQVSGEITNVGNLFVGFNINGGVGHGIYNLTGGSIYIGATGITTTGGSYEVNLGGGTVGAYASWASSLNMNLTGVNGPVTFNPAGNTITLSGALSGAGGLTVAGGGTLDLSGANSYLGDTTVNAGTLQLDQTGSTLGAIRLANGALLNLNFSGNYYTAHFYTNGVALPFGTYNHGNLPGFIAASSGNLVVGIFFVTQPQNTPVYLNQSHSGTLTSATAGGSATYQWYLNGNAVSGATGSSLALSNLQITNGGNYYVVATGGSDSVTSSVVSVTIFGENNSLFAYEGFQYPSGSSVDTLNGGFGWNGAWAHQWGNDGQIISGSLAGGANVPAGYDSRSITNAEYSDFGNDGRFLDCSTTSALWTNGYINASGNIGASNKTIYVSFLQMESSSSGGYWEFDFQRGNLGDPGRMGGVGNDVGDANVHLRSEYPAGGGSTMYTIGLMDANNVDFYVVRIDYIANGANVRVYRNPTSTTEPAVPALTVSNLTDYSFNGFAMARANGPTMSVDEIRVGATWDDAIGLAVSNLLPPTKITNGYMVQFACTPGYSYRIQRATALTGPWTTITTVVGPANAFVQYNDTSAPSGQAFYRTVTP
jgi:autotransporter-associated beta strand protein